ncbi:hypothetical protein ACDY96_25940 [Rhizobium mongolense]|uniref:hypothetical protein n=1 Tax=Rhizobium mongolense TaxID=57676 RepID=UPI00355888B8
MSDGITRAEYLDLDRRIEHAKSTAVAAQRALRHGNRQGRSAPDPASQLFSIFTFALKAAGGRRSLAAFAEGNFPPEIAARIIEAAAAPAAIVKAATNPAQTAVPAWAAELVGLTISAAELLAPQSAFARLAARPSVLKIDSATGAVRLPAINPGDLGGAFVAEGQPIPTGKSVISGSIISGYKAAVLSTFTRELARSTSFANIVRSTVSADMGTVLDVALFGSAAATAAQPAGPLHDVPALAASSADGSAGVAEDLSGLAAAVSPSTDLIFISRAETRIRGQLLCPAAANVVTWIDSNALDPAKVVAVDAGSLALAGSANVDFSVSEQSVVVDENTAPVPEVGTAQTSSLWQMGLVGLKGIVDAGWAARRAGMVAHIDAVDW